MDILPDSDFFYTIVIRKSSFSFGTFGLGQKWHQHTVAIQPSAMFFPKQSQDALTYVAAMGWRGCGVSRGLANDQAI